MTTKRYSHNHRDLNEQQLVKFAQSLGGHWLAEGPLDGWLFHRGLWLPVEIKRPEREGLAHEYTPMQRRFFTWCNERGARWLVWRTSADVIKDLGGRVAA
jgi:hypothetical protein